MKLDQYGDQFVEKDQSFHVFYDVFCEFRQVKNIRRVNRDKISQLIGLTDRKNIVETHDFWRVSRNNRDFCGVLTEIAISRQKSVDFDDMGKLGGKFCREGRKIMSLCPTNNDRIISLEVGMNERK